MSLNNKSWLSFKVAALTSASLFMVACNQSFETAVSDSSATTETHVSSKQAALTPDPALVRGELENGVEYYILPNATPPGQGALRVVFDAGSLAEVEGTAGLAHYLEHMAFNGSENVPEGEMIQMLERLGLSFGADTNASTGLEFTTYKLNLPKTTNEVLDAAFMLMRETASNLTLDQDAIDRELGIILSEKRTRDSANYRAWEANMRFRTSGSDVMERLPIGTEETLRSITAQDFRDFYDSNYHPEKTKVIFVGDADPVEIEKRIKDAFGDWENKTDPAPTAKPSPAKIIPGNVMIHAEEGLYPTVSLMAMRPYVEREDTVEMRNERTLRGLGFRILNNRLRKISEQTDRPFLTASGGSNATLDVTEGAMLSATIQPEMWESALRGMDTELRRALEFGFDQVELEAEMRRFDASYKARAEGADTRATTSRFGGLIDSVTNAATQNDVFTHPNQSLERWKSLRSTITLEDVNEAFRERWGPVDELSVYLRLPDDAGLTPETVKAVLTDNRKIKVTRPEAKATPVFAYSNHGAPGEIISDVKNDDVDARFVIFDNNVSLIVKQTDYEDDRVNVRIDFGDGSLSSPQRNEGMRRMSLAVMKNSGLEAHTPDELRDIMAGRLVRTDAFTNRDDEDRFIINAQTIPADLRTQLDIFAAQLLAQNFSEDARLNYIEKLKAWYPTHDTNIEGIASREIKRLIYDDERFGFDSEDQFYSASLKEIENWLRPQLETGQLSVTIVGDIDPNTAIELVSETLGALPERKPHNAPDDERVSDMRNVAFPLGGDRVKRFYHRGDDNQSQLRIYWPADDAMNPAYARQLSVLRSVLRSRLVTEIREGEATTYSPGAGSHASQVFDDFGYVVALLTLKPQDVDSMSKKVRKIAADLAASNITDDEFNRARMPMLEKLYSTEKTNPYWLNILAQAHGEDDGVSRHNTRRSDYENMSVEDVKAIAKDVLINEVALEIRILPEE